MKYLALALIFIGGCNELLKPTVPSADIAAEIAVRYAAAMLKAPKPTPAPAPVTQCNKCTNGKVKTGDGLDWTQCECGDACQCAPKKEEPPPLVKVPEKPKTQNDGHVECRNGVCYWVERSTGKRYRIVQ